MVPGVTIGGFIPALFGSFVYAIINTALTGILGIDSGDSFYGSTHAADAHQGLGTPEQHRPDS